MSQIENRLNLLLPPKSMVPASVILRFLNGQLDPVTLKDDSAYGYTVVEQNMLLDIAERNKALIETLPSYSETPFIWFSNAGGPGAGKSTKGLQYIAELYGIEAEIAPAMWAEPSLGAAIQFISDRVPVAFLSPDRKSLPDIWQALGSQSKIDEAFYLHNRSATNGLWNFDKSIAYARHTNIFNDTTLSGHNDLPKVKDDGGYTVVLATASPIALRDPAANQRNAAFFQSLPTDVSGKDRAFGEKLPSIAAPADEIHFAWRDAINQNARDVALKVGNRLSIIDAEGFAEFCALYPALEASVLSQWGRDDSVRSEVPNICARQKRECPFTPQGPK